MWDPRERDRGRRRASRRQGRDSWDLNGSIERPITTSDLLTAPDAPIALGPVGRQVRAELDSAAELLDDDVEEILEVGSLVGQRYVIEQHISSGGFGAVYRASDREMRHHQVALKLLHYPSASEEERLAALRELRLLATVTHPSVVQFKEYGWHEGRLWFAMPWYRGQTLDRIIGDESTAVGMSREEARPLFTRLAHGLAAMHAVGIHHHDIKPENIFVAQIAGFPGGLPVLLDLGIATQRGEHPIGLTVGYASPETAAAMLGDASVPIGGAADVYSLALVLRNVLDPRLATPPETGEEVGALLRARVANPAALSKKRDLKYLAPHFRRWLSKDPQERPTAAELAAEFAVLTEPEEKRAAKLRFLRRALPTLILMALMITALSLQLRRKETALVVQSRELEHQRHVGEALQRQSEAQLAQLALSAKKLGNERRLLKESQEVARGLKGRLTEAEKRLADVDRLLSDLTAERDKHLQASERLSAERDVLAQEKATLLRDHATIVAERDRLSSDLEKITGERDKRTNERDDALRTRDETVRERTQAVAERDEARTKASALEKRLAALTKEHDQLERDAAAQEEKRERVARQRAEALAQVKELEQKLATAKVEQTRLERQLRELKERPAPAPRVASAQAPKKKRAGVRPKRP